MRELSLFLLYIAVFLLAMQLLRNGLLRLSGNTLKRKISQATDTPIKGFASGMIFTAILQSSSAVMAMTVGLVSIGSLSFTQSLGIILGSNIGTTVTAEFMTFSMKSWILPGLASGILLMLIPNSIIRSIGGSIFGLFLLFFSIQGFSSLAKPLASYPYFFEVLRMVEEHLLLAVLAGALISGIIHSGTATIGIAMGFITGGEMTVATGIAIMLGSNIGTCVTGYIASIGAAKEAKLTAYAHIWLNILGVLLFYPFISHLETAAAMMTDVKQVQLAHASVLFNVICSLLTLPFIKQFERFIRLLHDPG